MRNFLNELELHLVTFGLRNSEQELLGRLSLLFKEFRELGEVLNKANCVLVGACAEEEVFC